MSAPTRPRGHKPSSLRYYQDGPPPHVDIDAWSLSILGEAGVDAVLSFADLRLVPWLVESRRYVCVCNWSVRALWGGYLLADVLSLAGWNGETNDLYLKQTSIGTPAKGVYESTIPLRDSVARRALLVTEIDGAPLSLERGYPLRLLDFGLYGYKSVKGLATLEITTSFELGKWERKAGYSLDGQIQPKRYRMCDLDRHEFLVRSGEVTEF